MESRERISMDEKHGKSIRKRVLEDPLFLRTDEYIDEMLEKDTLTELVLQIGPNCNLECPHCYGAYGPKRKGFPQLKFVRKALEESVELGIEGITLTDGEPIRLQTKDVLGLAANFSDRIPLTIMTNAKFANTVRNTARWISFLKDEGFELNRDGNLIYVSFGEGYKVHWKNYHKLNVALKVIYPDANFGKHLRYSLLYGLGEDETELADNVASSLANVFGLDGEIEFFPESNGKVPTYVIPYKKGEYLFIDCNQCDPQGRATDLNVFDGVFLFGELSVSKMGFLPREAESLYVAHDGRVSYGIAGGCVREERYAGSLETDSLGEIKRRIQSDEIYQAKKIGGTRFLYAVAQDVNPDFRVFGKIGCDVCHSFFSDSDIIEGVRRRLSQDGVAESYKQFIGSFDLSNKEQCGFV